MEPTGTTASGRKIAAMEKLGTWERPPDRFDGLRRRRQLRFRLSIKKNAYLHRILHHRRGLTGGID